MKIISDSETEFEIELENGTVILALKNLREISVFRNDFDAYRSMKWNDLTLDEQNAIEILCS